jgi:glutathione synthase/RimK-type ligase-like ATP-grasp enzyme
MSQQSNPIVIFGSRGDQHADATWRALAARGHEALFIDAQRFPADLPLSLGALRPQIEIAGLHLDRPAAVYVRSLYTSPIAYGAGAEAEMAADWRRTLAVYRERTSLLSAVLLRWERAGVPLYNPVSAQTSITKPYQLSLLAEAGLPVPATLWSNDPAQVRRFAAGRRVVYKPVVGGAATRALTSADLSDERLATLAAAPVTFQELLPGDDVRVYVIDGRIAAALRIESDAIDFRQNERSIAQIELPAAVRAQCLRAAELIGLRFTGMDLKRDEHGTLRFLELNPSPMFLGFDARAGTRILDALCDALLAHLDPAGGADPGRRRQGRRRRSAPPAGRSAVL